MKPDRRPLRVRDERPRSDGVVDKCNDPPPHGVAPAEDSIGYKKNITFREFYRSLRQAGPRSATETTAICRKYLCTPLYGSRRIEGGTIYASIAMAMIATRTSGQRNRTGHAARFGRGLSASGPNSACDRFEAGLCTVKKVYNK
jgi:hypothetical protein